MIRVSTHLKHPRLLLAGVAVFAMGMIGGMVRSADLIGEFVSDAVLVHAPGRVAGATTFTAGSVTLTLELPGNTVTAVVDVSEPISIFSLLRIAARRGALTFDTAATKDGEPFVRTINGVAAPDGQAWVASVGDETVTDINAPLIQGGDTVAIRRR